MIPYASYVFSSILSVGMMEEGLYLLRQQAILVKAPIFKVLLKVSKGIELQQVVSGTAAEHKLGTNVLAM